MGRPRVYDDRVSCGLRLPRELHERLTTVASEREVSVNLICIRAIERHLAGLPTLPDGRPDWGVRPPVFDEEFGLCLDPCEHPSINGTTCAVCGQEVEL